MPRYARKIEPGTLIHIISRFHSGEHRIVDRREREEYLYRAGRALERTDWKVLSFGIMSSHPHWGAIAGSSPFSRWFGSFHGGFARWLNTRQGRYGQVFAERPKTIVMGLEDAGRLIAYHHNNPVVAGVAESARASAWTSHRAYLGLEAAYPWLHVDLGLELCGFSNDAEGRAGFDRFVEEQRLRDLDPLVDGSDLRAARRELRARLGSAVEVSYPTVDLQSATIEHGVTIEPHSTLRMRWPISADMVIEAAAVRTGVPPTGIRSESREARRVSARRLTVVTGRALGLSLTEMARGLGMSVQGASYLERTARSDVCAEAEALARALIDGK